ncbi:MAG: hypothetical protein L6R40_006663 [Gallowayella cf. fulva]|nr:MAG: hypothetical protein L6R40_006663 [Xanthomendoza cf. fulva]
MSNAGESQSPSPETPPSKPIVLQVGEERFYVNQDTLSRSGHLEAVASVRWDHNKQSDGSFFVDADPEVFKHILRFLRHGVYPLCYDKSKGHDFVMYAAIHQLASYLLVEDLMKWLSKAQYLNAVMIETTARVEDDEDGLGGTQSSDTTVEYYPTGRTVKKYVCPRGISKHYDNPRGCGKDCRRAQGDAEDEYEDAPVVSTLVVTQKVIFNQHLCVEEQ